MFEMDFNFESNSKLITTHHRGKHSYFYRVDGTTYKQLAKVDHSKQLKRIYSKREPPIYHARSEIFTKRGHKFVAFSYSVQYSPHSY